jgi:uncharacterized damage-inducible protein DinB
MIRPEPFSLLARYNAWMNRRLLALAEQLSEEGWRRDLGAFFRSVEGTFNHLLLGDRFWLSRLTGDPSFLMFPDADGNPRPFTGLDMILYRDRPIFAEERRRTDADLSAWVATLDQDALGRHLAYRNASGQDVEIPVWVAVTHLFNHQTHHRGQLSSLFLQLGLDPGVTDLVVMARDRLDQDV